MNEWIYCGYSYSVLYSWLNSSLGKWKTGEEPKRQCCSFMIFFYDSTVILKKEVDERLAVCFETMPLSSLSSSIWVSTLTVEKYYKKNFVKCHFWFPHWTDVPHESKPILYPPTDIPLFFGESTKSGVGHCPPVVPLGCPTWCAVLTPPGVSVRVPGTLWWLPESCL